MVVRLRSSLKSPRIATRAPPGIIGIIEVRLGVEIGAKQRGRLDVAKAAGLVYECEPCDVRRVDRVVVEGVGVAAVAADRISVAGEGGHHGCQHGVVDHGLQRIHVRVKTRQDRRYVVDLLRLVGWSGAGLRSREGVEVPAGDAEGGCGQDGISFYLDDDGGVCTDRYRVVEFEVAAIGVKRTNRGSVLFSAVSRAIVTVLVK